MNLNQYIDAHASLHYRLQGGKDKVEEGPFFKLGTLLTKWNPDDTADKMWTHSVAHPDKGQGIPRFNFMNQSEARLAKAYEAASLPFILYNIPELNDAAVNGGFNSAHLASTYGKSARNVERSNDNHFTYYHKLKTAWSSYPEWTPLKVIFL